MTRAHPPAFRGIVFAVAAFAAWPAFTEGAITAVPPAAYRAPSTQKAAPVTMMLPQGSPAARVALPEPTAAERASLRARNAPAAGAQGKASTPKGLAIAFPRGIPESSRAIALAALPWQALGDGSRAAKLEVVSPGAAALRVALALSANVPGVTLRFTGNGANAQSFGPVAANDVAADAARFGEFWSPVLAGDVATIEFHVASGVGIPDAVLTLTRVSHQVVAPAALTKLDAKAVDDIGTSGPCNIDVACVTPRTQAFVDSTKAVAATEQTKDDGFTYLCTGTLLNDSLSSNTPYLFSASHCIDSAMAARTLNTFWFFDAVACGSKTVPAFIQQASGAALLARSTDWDWALVRLNAAPPAGTHFSAWRAEPIPNGATISVIHHPWGDLTKWSQATVISCLPITLRSDSCLEPLRNATVPPVRDGEQFASLVIKNPHLEPARVGPDAPLACFDYQPIMLAKEFENVYEAQGGVLAFIGSPEDVLKPNWEHRERWEALKLRAKQWMESMHREAQQYADTKMFYGIRETHRSSIRRLFHLGYLKELPAFLDKQRDVAVEYPTCGKCQLRQDSPHVVQCQRCNWIIDPARAYELQVITEDDPALERLTRDEVKKLGISPYVAETADERPVRLKAGLPKPKSEAAMRLLDQQAELEEQEEERKAAKRRNSENQQQ